MRIEDDVLAVLSRCLVDGNRLMLPDQLERKLYLRVNKALEAAGGKWSRAVKAHVFEQEAAERVDQMILSGEVVIPKDEFNFFRSPPAVIERLLDLALIEPGMRVLEPSAGDGAIALAVAACCRTPGSVDCFELMSANYHKLKAMPQLGFVELYDFLLKPAKPVYDRVVMNPPFAKRADVRHINHAMGFLKPGGRLVSVMSVAVTFRADLMTAAFRKTIEIYGSIETLPDDSFKASGTSVRTVIVVLDKPDA